MNRKNAWILTFTATLILAGCSKPYAIDETNTGVENIGNTQSVYGADGYTTPGNSDIYGNQTHNAQAANGDFYQDPGYGVNVVGGPTAVAKDRVIYFSYDSAALDARSAAVVREHAQYLRAHPTTRVVLEGHTDERGSREYNIGLGERRAYSVRNLFQQEGVKTAQLRVLSYGEERPAANCQSELCYAKNRRVVIIY